MGRAGEEESVLNLKRNKIHIFPVRCTNVICNLENVSKTFLSQRLLSEPAKGSIIS